MKSFKRFLSGFMTLILVLSTVSITSSAETVDPFEGMINLEEGSEWQGSVFGDNGGQSNITSTNFEVTENEDGTVTLRSANNRGKIASGTEGIAYYFQEIPDGANFELTAKAHVDAWTANNQVAFGLMLRSNVLDNTNLSTFTGDYVAVGALDQVMKGFHKQQGTMVKDGLDFSAIAPANGQAYDLSIQKAGDLYVLKIGDETKIIENFTGDINYAGLFVSRNTTVTFSDISLVIDTRVLNELQINAAEMKTDYLVGESLDLTGLEVIAIYDDGSEAIIESGNYIVTGFDSSEVGINTISINFNGVTATVDLNIVPLTVTGLEIKYYPAKTIYYPLDTFNPLGLVVVAEYNSGYSFAELTADQYTILVEGQSTTDAAYVFQTAGNKTVTVQSNETVSQSIDFDVTVKDANIVDLEIRKNPEKMQYFIGDELDLDGIAVYAKYSDGSEVRLMNSEFEVASFDSQVVGDQDVVISHKGETVVLTLNVKVKESQGLVVTHYPKTTFFVGETFDATGLVVSKVYDNGDQEVMTEYELNTEAYDSTQSGVYTVIVVPNDEAIESTEYQVTVRDEKVYEWKQIVFGQSSGSSRNSINVKPDGTVEVIALEGGGKVTGDHDGISFYYTEIDANEDNFVLSADIKVTHFAKTPYDGQEAFGIMARDAIGTNFDSSVFASNIAAVGGYSGGTREQMGTQLFVRTGVLGPDGEGSKGIQKVMLDPVRPTEVNTHPVTNYRLTLSKTNSGFIGQMNDGEEAIIFEPEILGVQDSKIYVGFFAARLATIEVSNVDFTVTAAATDAPRVEPPKVATSPNLEVVSLNKVSLDDYNLMIRPNVNGVVTVKQGQNIIANDIEVLGGKVVSIPTTLTKNTNTNFSITFVPDNTQFLTSYDVMVKNFTVTMRTYVENGDIYVSPIGTNLGDGTIENPLDLDTAIEFVRPGQRIIVQEGRYVRNSSLEIKKYNDGTPDAMKYLVAAEGARPIIDFDQRSEGVVHSGNYWHVIGLDFTRSAGNTKGYTIGGSHNIIELSRFYENGDTGLQISRTDHTEEDRSKWPSHNLILNVTSFDNRDPAENNADGFAAKLTSGEGNIFRGAIAHNNIDDGWDLYTKVGTGAIGAVIIEDSIAYNNGFLTNGYVGAGDKNGFKLGGEGVHVPHIIRNSVAFGNGADGFSSNSNPGVIAYNNIAFNNKTNLNFYTYVNITPDFTIDGFISYHNNNVFGPVRDKYPAGLEADNNFLYNGTESLNASGQMLTDSNFNNLVMPTTINRLEDGSIDFSFLQFDPEGTQEPEVPENPVEPVEPPTDAVFFDNFEGATGANFFTAEYKALPNDATKPMYIRTGGSVPVGIGSITLDAGRMTIGALSNVVTTADSTPGGVFDLSRPYEIILNVTNVQGTGNFIVYVDNNTTSQGSSPHGNASRLYQVASNEIPVGALVIPGEVGTENSFIQLRTASGGSVTIDSIIIKYAEEDTTEPEDPTPVEPVEPVDPVDPVDPTPEQPEVTFKDLQGYGWATNAIEALASKGIILGTSTTEKTFSPAANITRADFIILLVKTLGLTADVEENFSDIKQSDYFYNEVGIAKALGISVGMGNNDFNPRSEISRQDMMTLTVRAMEIAELNLEAGDASTTEHFVDNKNIATYAAGSVATLVKNGLIVGYGDNTIQPVGKATRAETATFLYRIYNLK